MTFFVKNIFLILCKSCYMSFFLKKMQYSLNQLLQTMFKRFSHLRCYLSVWKYSKMQVETSLIVPKGCKWLLEL